MAPDDLSLACRLSGLSIDELWLRYLEIGGSRSRTELAARLGGGGWSAPEDGYLAVVADEALQERGLPRLSSPEAAWGPLLADGVPGEGNRPVLLSAAAAAAVLGARAHGTRLSSLFERCARARENARGVRHHAESVRRECHLRSSSRGGD